MHSDEELVERAISGDREAYALLYDKYASMVRALCVDATGNLEVAQDQAQEVFLRAYRRLSTLREPNQFAAWLIGIARHVNQEWHKQKRRNQKVLIGIPAEALAVDSDGPVSFDTRFAQAFAQLPENQRVALSCVYLEGMSAADAQKVLQLSSSGFYKLLSQSRQRLVEIIDRGN
jgi:RNA polymerase sigma-70 factor, ECF subfamily